MVYSVIQLDNREVHLSSTFLLLLLVFVVNPVRGHVVLDDDHDVRGATSTDR